MAIVIAGSAGVVLAQSVDVTKELQENREAKVPLFRAHPWQWFRSNWLKEMDHLNDRLGLQAGVSFTTIYQHAAGLDSPNNTLVETLDVLARWQLFDLGMLGRSALGGTFRNRNNFDGQNGNDLSQSIGLPWGINNSGSSGYTRLNQFWWEQSLLQRTLIVKAGRLDEPSLFDQNRAAARDTTQFMIQPLVHNQTIAFPSNGMGFNLRYQPNGSFYVTAGFGDANGDPNRTASGGLSSFGEGRYFEAAEVGISPDLSAFWGGNADNGTYRLMGWNTATTSSHAAGYGFALSFDQQIGNGIVPFVRVGYCPNEVFRSSIEVSWGVAMERPFGRASDSAGIGASWSKPVAFAKRDQYAMEVFYRLEVVEGISLSPDIELLPAPALQPDREFIAVLGMRARLAL